MLDRRQKVLYLTRGGPIAGEQRQLLYLLRGLDRDRYVPVVLCARPGRFAEELSQAGIHCQIRPLAAWRSLRGVFSRYRDAGYVSHLARDEAVTLVHCSDFWMTPYGLRAARHAAVPCVLHIRAPIDARKLRKYHCDQATTLVPISLRVHVRLLEAAPEVKDKVVLIHDAVDKDVFVPKAGRRDLSVWHRPYDTAGKVVIGLVGRIEPGKEQMGFVHIAREVLGRTPNATFLMIGDIKDPSYHEELTRLIETCGLAGRVHFTGRLEDMPEVLAGLDVLVSLSGGSVRYEAMMCGVPVVCAWSRTAQESLHIRHEETGFLVPQRDVGEVADVLVKIIEDADLRAKIGRSARAWAEQHLSHTTLVEETQRLYDRLLTDAGGQS
jgi:glycosyltransferase involved in cell wall biosynthesis